MGMMSEQVRTIGRWIEDALTVGLIVLFFAACLFVILVPLLTLVGL